MSYLVLARKYRPKSFSEMVGQTHVVQALGNALQTQRLHHAYLFTGTRGVGKTTVSRILAKSLNCLGADGQGGITATPCGVCQACADIDAGRFVDYTELDAASNRGVDEIAQLLEQAVYKPVVGRFKVFMIDEVHMLTNTAFNAMLKTLEEPPAYLKFVLATTDPQKVPATVLSRCLQFNLRPMAPETIVEHLAAVLDAEQIPAEPQALKLLARAARGSMRDALSLTDQAIAFGSGRLPEANVRQMLGSVDRTHVLQLLQALAVGDGRQVVALSESLRLSGLSAASTLEEMSVLLQRMAVLQAVPDAVNDAEMAEVAELAAQMPADETQLLYSLCLHGRAELGLAPDEYAALTMVLLRLLPFKKPVQAPVASASTELAGGAVEPPKKPRPEPSGPSVRPSAGQERLQAAMAAARLNTAALQRPPVVQAQAAVPAPATSSAKPPWEEEGEAPVVAPADAARPAEAVTAAARPAAGVNTAWADLWSGWVQALLATGQVTGLVRELALQSELVAQEGGTWTLRVDRQSLQHPGACDKLLAALQALDAGAAPERLQVELGSVGDSQARRLAAAQAERQQRAEQIIEGDAFVQEMVQRWGARIVPGSIKPWVAPTASGEPV